MTNNPNLKITTLGGVEEVGCNAYLVQYKNEIVMIDAGLGFPDNNCLGLDFLLPNTNWLHKHKKKIKAIVLTHAHLDHVGALPYIIKDLDYPKIIGLPFTIEFVKRLIKDKIKGPLPSVEYQTISTDDIIRFKELQLSFFGLTHNIPHSMGVAVHTPEGVIVHPGDYKLDDTLLTEKPPEYKKIKQLGREGVLAALLESTNAFYPGKSKSEREIAEVVEGLMKQANGRTIIATFSSLVTRLAAFIQTAQRLNKKIYLSGRSLENNIKIARKLHYLNIPDGLLIKAKDLNSYPDNRIIVLATGSQGEPLAALSRIANNQHSSISLKPTDTIIMSSSVIPGNDIDVTNMMDKLAKKGCKIINNTLMNVHTSGHPYQEDMIELTKFFNPRYIIPIHGPLSFHNQHKYLLTERGFQPENILIPKNGHVIGFDKGKVINLPSIPANYQAMIGSKILPINSPQLFEKKQILNQGICLIILPITKDKPKLKGEPKVIFKAIPTLEAPENIANELSQRIIQWYPGVTSKRSRRRSKKLKQTFIRKADTTKTIKKQLYKKVGIFLKQRLGKSPLIVIETD